IRRSTVLRQTYLHRRDTPSFPTRRSSDLRGPDRGWPAAHASCPRCEWPGRRSSSCEHLGLDAGELGAAESGQIDETTEVVTVEKCAFSRALDLDELSRAGHDHIHIGLGPRILDIGQVEQRLTVDDADADGGDG